MGDEDPVLLMERWMAGDHEAGCAWLDRTVAANLDHVLLGQAVDERKGDPQTADRERARAQQRLWKQYLPHADLALCARLQQEDRLRPALLGGLDGDAALLRRWVADNASAGIRLHRRHYASLLRFITNMVNHEQIAEELTNDTFMDLLKQRHDIREFRPLMYTIARFKVYAWFKARMKRPIDVDTDGLSQIAEPSTEGPDARAVKRSSLKLLLRALHSLPINQQMVLVLYRWEDMSAREIGEVFGWDEPNVRGKIRLGIARMKTFLEDPPPADDGTPSDTTELLEWFNALHNRALEFVGGAVPA